MIIITSILIFAYVSLTSKYKMYGEDGEQRLIGDLQFRVLSSYQEGEKALQYVDRSAGFAALQAAYTLGQDGGFFLPDSGTDHNPWDMSDCGEYGSYNFWNNKSADCYPEDFKSSYVKDLDRELNSYISLYSAALIPVNNYVYLVSDNGSAINLTGIALRPIDINIGKQILFATSLIHGEGIFIWPVDDSSPLHKLITSCFGLRNCVRCDDQTHDAVDIDGTTGDLILAAADGVVTRVGGTYNLVALEHADGYETYYLHNNKLEVEVGDEVKQGQVIARMGGWGRTGPNHYGDHLHFGIKKDGQWLDPLDPRYGFYDIEKLGLTFSHDANCCYAPEQYQYSDLMTCLT